MPRTRKLNQQQGTEAQALGKFFESQVDRQLAQARLDGLVSWHDVNQPLFRCVGRQRYVPVAQGKADRSGQLRGGLTFALEIKSTEDATLPRSEVKKQQAQHLDDTAGGGGLALLLVQFRCVAGWPSFAVPWATAPWHRAGGGMSLQVVDLVAYRIGAAGFLALHVVQCPKCKEVQQRRTYRQLPLAGERSYGRTVIWCGCQVTLQDGAL